MNKRHMLISRKAVALICLLSIITGAFSTMLYATEYVYDEPLEPDMWVEPDFDDPSTYAYSFAFVGDTQCLMIGDRLNGTNKVERLYKYVAGTAEERKLEHVFVLGDITEVGYWNDYNMVNAAKDWPMVTEEWEIAQRAIFQLNGKVKYSLCRGNHDDYMMDDYFNVPAYTNQFKNEGGFFSDTGATYPNGGRNQTVNPTGAIYWSAKTGANDETIANSWRTMEICGTKYLFITVDYNPSAAVANWVDRTLSSYPDHKAIITTHSYMESDGNLIPSEQGEVYYPSEYGPANMWKKVYSKHSNVFMIVCGHATGANVPIYTVTQGIGGNKVYQFLINPQTYDTKEPRKEGESAYGTQDQGLVMYMNFSEDGKTISLNYYSTLLNKFLKGANYSINVDAAANESGTIDMAGFADFGQVTPLVTNKKTATLDGVISEGEYSSTKVTKKEDIAVGSISSDVNEYFSYDNKYIYYAVKAKSVSCSMSLHLGDSLYYLDELNSDLHSKTTTVSFGYIGCTQTANDCYSKIINNQDIACKIGTDTASNCRVYEVKISREYLENNGSPDNVLSYTLKLGSAVHRFNIDDDAKAILSEAGVENDYDWTYNYAYFGSRPEVEEEPDNSEDTTPPENNEDTDPAENTDTGEATQPVENTDTGEATQPVENTDTGEVTQPVENTDTDEPSDTGEDTAVPTDTETSKNTDTAEITDTPDSTVSTADTSAEKTERGCSSTASFASVLFITALTGTAVVIKKKKD